MLHIIAESSWEVASKSEDCFSEKLKAPGNIAQDSEMTALLRV